MGPKAPPITGHELTPEEKCFLHSLEVLFAPRPCAAPPGRKYRLAERFAA